MAGEAPRPTRLIARPPRNLLQWLRQREIRPTQNRNLPTPVFKGLIVSLTDNDRNTPADIFVKIGLDIRDLREEIQFKPEPHVKDMLRRLIFSWSEVTECHLKEEANFNFALDHGFLEICFHMLRKLYSLCEAPCKVSIRKSCFLFLWKLIHQARRQNRSKSVEFATKEIESILRHNRGLMFSLTLMKVSKQLPCPVQARYQRAISLAGDLRLQTPDVFDCLRRKFKEGIHSEIRSFTFGKGFHSILNMHSGLANIVHEAYCLASCIESLFSQTLVEDVRRLILLASLRLQDLLLIIHTLIVTYPRHCSCETCMVLPEKLIFAGLPRLIHVLISVILSASVAQLRLIEAIFEDLSAIIIQIIHLYSQDLVMWYVMYPLPDFVGLHRVCDVAETWLLGNYNQIHYTRRRVCLEDAEELIRSFQPVQYILERPFREIVIDLEREYCLHDKVLSIDDFNHFCTEREFNLNFSGPLKLCLHVLIQKIYSCLLDRQYWIDEYWAIKLS